MYTDCVYLQTDLVAVSLGLEDKLLGTGLLTKLFNWKINSVNKEILIKLVGVAISKSSGFSVVALRPMLHRAFHALLAKLIYCYFACINYFLY